MQINIKNVAMLLIKGITITSYLLKYVELYLQYYGQLNLNHNSLSYQKLPGPLKEY